MNNEKCMIIEVCSAPNKDGKFEVSFSKDPSVFNIKQNCAIVNMCDSHMIESVKPFLNITSPSSSHSNLSIQKTLSIFSLAPSHSVEPESESEDDEEEK
jgi:hypothetical protein